MNMCLNENLKKKKKKDIVTLPHLALTVLVHDESSSVRHVRRMFHPGRGLGGPRARRTNMHFTSGSTGGLSSSSSQSSTYTPSNREAMDPIAGKNQRYTGVLGGSLLPGGKSWIFDHNPFYWWLWTFLAICSITFSQLLLANIIQNW